MLLVLNSLQLVKARPTMSYILLVLGICRNPLRIKVDSESRTSNLGVTDPSGPTAQSGHPFSTLQKKNRKKRSCTMKMTVNN